MAHLLTDSPLASRFHPSPNHGERRPGSRVDALILHYTGMEDAQSALDRLCEDGSDVSCHYFVFEDGSILQLVRESRRAWHAGRGSWAGETDLNSASIGIEIVNPGHDRGYPDFPDAQIAAAIALCADICQRLAIKPARVLGHSDIAPDRKIDPGEKFPWERLHRAGVGHYLPPAALSNGASLLPGDRGEAVAALQGRLRSYGYGLEQTGLFDDATALVVRAFQRHFRPALVDGIADSSTIATLHELTAVLPKA